MITSDLINWIDSCSYNLSSNREKLAIGEFSMGGKCVQVALNNSDKFIAFVSHCGYPSVNGLADDVPYICNETDSVHHICFIQIMAFIL